MKLAKIEAEIRKDFKPKRNSDNTLPDTVERRIKKAFKQCRVPIQITGEEIISPEVTIPVTRVTSWIKSGYSNRRVNTGVTTTIIFGPLGLRGLKVNFAVGESPSNSFGQKRVGPGISHSTLPFVPTIDIDSCYQDPTAHIFKSKTDL